MPTCAPTSSSDAACPAPRAALRGLADDEASVTEVLGQILMFAVLSMVLVLSLVAFGAAKDRAAERAAELQAEAAAQQVASAVVEASLFIESRGAAATYERRIDLREMIEDREYAVHLEPEDLTHTDRVRVVVGSYGVEATAPLFRAGAPVGITLSSSEVAGGPLEVVFGPCPPLLVADCLYLEGST